jgi:hypothetical protein
MGRLGLGVQDQALEVEPEVGVHDRELAHRLPLREDREAVALVVEVLELDVLEGALAEPFLRPAMRVGGDALVKEVESRLPKR